MIDHDHDLPITHQCRVLGVARSTVYYRRQPVSDADHALMHPFFGIQGEAAGVSAASLPWL